MAGIAAGGLIAVGVDVGNGPVAVPAATDQVAVHQVGEVLVVPVLHDAGRRAGTHKGRPYRTGVGLGVAAGGNQTPTAPVDNQPVAPLHQVTRPLGDFQAGFQPVLAFQRIEGGHVHVPPGQREAGRLLEPLAQKAQRFLAPTVADNPPSGPGRRAASARPRRRPPSRRSTCQTRREPPRCPCAAGRHWSSAPAGRRLYGPPPSVRLAARAPAAGWPSGSRYPLQQRRAHLSGTGCPPASPCDAAAAAFDTCIALAEFSEQLFLKLAQIRLARRRTLRFCSGIGPIPGPRGPMGHRWQADYTLSECASAPGT